MTYPKAPTSRFKQVALAVLAAVFCAAAIRQAGADVTVTPNPTAPDETDAYEVKVDSNGVEITSQTLRPPAPWRFKVVGRNAQGQPMYARTTADPMKYLFTLPKNGPMAVQGRWRTLAGLDPMSAADLWEPEMDGKLELPPPSGTGGKPLPLPPDADWKVKVKGRTVLLAIDSTNTKGQGLPAMSEFLNANKAQAPGKIVLCDLNDADNDGVPDYADQTSGGVANSVLVPLLVAVPSNADMNGVKVKFTYDGPAEYAGGAWPSTALGRSHDFDYKDYRQARTGTLRLWKLSSLADDRKPDAASKKLIPAGKEVDATQLFARATAYQKWKYVTLYVEGINPTGGNISVQLMKNGSPLRGATDQVAVTSAELLVGFNGENAEAVNNPGGNNHLLPGTPDVAWNIGAEDQVTKDQGRGYPLWVTRKLMDKEDEKAPVPAGGLDGDGGMKGVNGPIDPMEIEGTHPCVITVPPEVKANPKFKVYIRAEGIGTDSILVYKGKSPRTDLLQYHRNTQVAADQIAETPILTVGSQWMEFDAGDVQSGDNVLVLKAKSRTSWIADNVTVRVRVAVADASGHKVVGDSVKCSYGDNFFGTYSFWKTHDEPLKIMPVAMMPVCNQVNPQRKYHLVHVHGFNYDSETEALVEFRQYHQRFFRAGFRGNYVGLTWPSGVSVNPVVADFDACVANAFQVAPTMRDLLLKVVAPRAGGIQNVDIYAHSLGNLPMWEMFRLSKGVPLLRNAFGSQAAVTSDAYLAVTNRVESYLAPNDPLSAAVQEHATWRGWYRGVDALAAVQSRYHHGYNRYDDALWNKFRVNDWLMRESGDNRSALWTVIGSPGSAPQMIGGMDHTVKTAGERERSEVSCYIFSRNTFQPQVHKSLRGPFLFPGLPRDPDMARNIAGRQRGDATDQINSLPLEVPNILNVPAYWQTLVPREWTLAEAKWLWYPGMFRRVRSVPENRYLYTHLDMPHGCMASKLVGEKVAPSINMLTDCNWSEWMHAGHRDQSLPAAWKFYSGALFEGINGNLPSFMADSNLKCNT